MKSTWRRPAITMAFQPIVDMDLKTVWGYEALVRGKSGTLASSVLAKVPCESMADFEEYCRARAFEQISLLWRPPLGQFLSVNASPRHMVENKSSVLRLKETVDKVGLSTKNVVIELTEIDEVLDMRALTRMTEELRDAGFKVAIDDFGSGHSGLLRLAAIPVDFVKLDMGLVRGLDCSRVKQGILEGVQEICCRLGLDLIAEGVESEGEAAELTRRGVRLLQGFLFARPEIGALPSFPGRWEKMAGEAAGSLAHPES